MWAIQLAKKERKCSGWKYSTATDYKKKKKYFECKQNECEKEREGEKKEDKEKQQQLKTVQT